MKRFLVPLVIAGVVILVFFAFRGRIANNLTTTPSPTSATQTTDTETLSVECNGVAIPQLTEGPYYKSSTPERQNIKGGSTSGTSLILEGYVFDTECNPITNAWIDFWQADGDGNYDNAGFGFRGHQYTNSKGYYRLETVIPGGYSGRTEHIHFKIRASENSPVITSQLFFPNSSSNSTDSIFDESLIVNMKDQNHATFNFVINK